ncbi:cytidine deaminase [Streptomyces armeniacus]|uniref:Cytidine deaminase n=1 Tax=Streptomyces armeniacus TaxID=83291 RepID=A0A345XPV0_9ACTN|nr:cytidine deaminase [Streptomyces armeniacus]AXK33666.1 cytidine deaminase [Streptomyces armeniacus]
MLTAMSDDAAAGLDPDPEDRKLLTLARSTRARNGVAEGAAVRDDNGRTYVAGTVELPSLRLSALRTAVAMAVASGAGALEAAAVVTAADGVPEEDLNAVRDLGGAGTPVLLAGLDGAPRATLTTG